MRVGCQSHARTRTGASGYAAAGQTAAREELRRELRYVRYETAPGPPMPEFAHLLGHGSYELAFRDAGLYEWLLQQRCRRCDKPLAPWHALA